MAGLPWQSFHIPELDREYVVALSQYAWETYAATASRLAFKRRLHDHLRAAHGLLGYSIWTALRRKRLYLLAVWETEQARINFGDPIPRETVRPGAARRADVPTWSLSWQIASDLYPPTWHEAFAKAGAQFPGKLVP